MLGIDLTNADLEATLVCKCDTQWNFILENIRGSNPIELIGSPVTQIDLNLLLGESFRKIHSKFMIDICTKGCESVYWEQFTNGKMERPIDIINPLTKKVNSVKLGIKLRSSSDNLFAFDVQMTKSGQPTQSTQPINKTRLLTHNLKSVLKAIKTSICELDHGDKTLHINIIKELIDEGLGMCAGVGTSGSFLEDAAIASSIATAQSSQMYSHQKIYIGIPQYLDKLKRLFPSMQIVYKLECGGELETRQYECVTHLLFVLVSNAFDSSASHTNIKFNMTKSNQLQILFESNGRKVSTNPTQAQEFAKLCGELKTYGGGVTVTDLDLQILVPINPMPNFQLDTSHVKQIMALDKSNSTILLVDDVFLNIKIIFNKLVKYLIPTHKPIHFPIITSQEWQEYGMFTIQLDNYNFIFGSNGLYGLDIGQMVECDLMIVDIQMPLLNGIDMIGQLISLGCKSKIIINSAFDKKELGDSEEIAKLFESNKSQIVFLEKGTEIDFSKIIEK